MRTLPADNWCVVWDPPLVTQLRCLSHRCLMSHRPHRIAKDTYAHPGEQRLTTLRHLGSRALRDTGPCRSWDQLTWPTITSSQQCPRTGLVHKPFKMAPKRKSHGRCDLLPFLLIGLKLLSTPSFLCSIKSTLKKLKRETSIDAHLLKSLPCS